MAMVTRTTGRTTTSFVAASVLSDWRTAPGMRLSRTMSRTTTGSVEERIAPTSNADARESPRRKCAANATSRSVRIVPGPSTSDGTSHSLGERSNFMRTASRNRTRARVTVPTASSVFDSGDGSMMPRLPRR